MGTNRRILLIEPPFHRLFKGTYSLERFPLALGYLSGEVRRRTDWQVRAYNADFAGPGEPVQVSYLAGDGFASYLRSLKDPGGAVWCEVRSVIESFRPSMVGITSKSQNFASARMVARIAKQIDPQVPVVLGGPHASLVGAEVLGCPDIDLAVRGEGERTLVELLRAVEGAGALDSIAGLVYRRDGRAVENAPREFIEDLDSLSFPHECAEEVLHDFRRYGVSAFRSIFATRGCPYRCFFCGSRGIWTRRVRFRSPASVVEEIRRLHALGLRSVHFDDDTFGVNRKYLRELCEAIRAGCRGVKWSCEIHVNLVDDETISLMKRAGCCSIQVGIESGSNRILREIRKDITIESALAACRTIRRHGLDVIAFFMVGFPQETEQTLSRTAAAMERADCDVLVYSIFTPYPGTEAYELCKRRGLIGDDYDASLYNHQSPANYFCPAIPAEQLRRRLDEIEKMVDRKNARSRLRRVFSRATVRRVRELGLRESLKKAGRVFFGR